MYSHGAPGRHLSRVAPLPLFFPSPPSPAAQEIDKVANFLTMMTFGTDKTVATLGKAFIGSVIISTAAGVGEELVFRGALQGGLQQLLVAASAPAALAMGLPLVVASLIFGVLHNYSNSPAYTIVAAIAVSARASRICVSCCFTR